MKTEMAQIHSQQYINNHSSIRLMIGSGWVDETAVRALFRLDSLFLSHQRERKPKFPYYDGIAILDAKSILYEYGFALIGNDCQLM